MKINTRKILLALLVVMTLLVSMATITASAADDSTVYLNPGNDWIGGDARFAIYTWGGAAGEKWIDMVDSDSDGIYEGVVPAGYSNIIFCRMNPAFTENKWNTGSETDDNKPVWNQTVDLTLYAGGTFTITDPWGTGDGKGANGTWEGGEVVGGTTPPIVDAGTPDVEGLELAIGDYYLCGWLNGAAYGIEGDSANLGDNKFVDGKLTVTFNEQSYVVIKDANNNSYWTQSYVTATTGTFYKGAAEKMMVPAGRVDFTLYKGEGDTFVLTYESKGHSGGNEGDPANAPDFDSYDKITVYLGNGLEWKNPMIYIWYRDDSGADYPYTSWENSLELEVDENNYYFLEIPSICNYIIFRDATSQTADLVIPTGDTMLFDNVTKEWVKKDSYKPLPPHSDTEKNVTVAVKNDAGWEDVYCYYWSVTGVEPLVWPGLPMEKGADGLYYIEIPEGNGYVIFNNGNTEEGKTLQTADLKIPTDDSVLFNNDTHNWEYLKLDANHPSTTPTPDTTPDNNEPETPDTPKAEMTFMQKIAKALLLWLRQMEEFFKNIWPFGKEQ